MSAGSTLVVLADPKEWTISGPGVEVVAARDYLSESRFAELRGVRVFNLCRSYRYQSYGYYVSLLATARGHRPIPGVTTIQGLRSATVTRTITEDLEDLVRRSLAPIQSDRFLVSIYFGRNPARRHDRLARALFNLFPAPLLRARFERGIEGWRLAGLRLIAMNDVPATHRDFLVQVATDYFQRGGKRRARARKARYDLAILVDPTAPESRRPSNEGALRRFERAAKTVGFAVDRITREDYGRIAEYDALFIRETTYVAHYTYRFAARGEAEGLAVIDDPESIVRCTNKVYLAELLKRHRIPVPRTLVVHRGNVQRVEPELGLPCVLKQPDSAFSQGVIKVATAQELLAETDRLLESSDLIVAQAFTPTEFDWRVGVIEGRPLFVSRYHMARRHWQIVQRQGERSVFGKVETLAVADAPRHVVRAAVRAAVAVGRGLYGVDVKQAGRRAFVIEVNDNPNIDSGIEDKVIGQELYEAVMASLMRQVEARGRRD
jgi:glutathione synthase/RimK-type ligase-like ATP-grasp enzyme